MKEKMFPKDVRNIVRKKLIGKELEEFNLTIEGKFHPTEAQLQRWKFLGGYYCL
jgi:hypothetical protein